MRPAPTGVSSADAETSVLPLGEGDQSPDPRWPQLWIRGIALTDENGDGVTDPLYLQVMAFAGAGVEDISAIQQLVTSLGYRYVGDRGAPD